jgi:hypothetical protein
MKAECQVIANGTKKKTPWACTGIADLRLLIKGVGNFDDLYCKMIFITA